MAGVAVEGDTGVSEQVVDLVVVVAGSTAATAPKVDVEEAPAELAG